MESTYYNEQAAAIGPGDIPVFALYLIVSAMVLGLGVLILSDIKDKDPGTTCPHGDCENYTGAFNQTIGNGIDALKTLGGWMDTIAIVIAAVIILGLVFLLFKSSTISL